MYRISNWKPADNIIVSFDDKTAEERSDDQINSMIKELIEVANKYDFDLSQWGTIESFRQYFSSLDLLSGMQK